MNFIEFTSFNQHTTHFVFQLIKKDPLISVNHDINNSILSVSALHEGASDVQSTYTLQLTTILVETTVLVEYKGLTIFSTKPVGCCTLVFGTGQCRASGA